MNTIISPLFFVVIMPIVYYMQIDTPTASLALSNDVNHSRYVTQYITPGSNLIEKEINTIEIWLQKVGNPIGNVTIAVFDSNENVVKQFAIINVASLGLTPLSIKYLRNS